MDIKNIDFEKFPDNGIVLIRSDDDKARSSLFTTLSKDPNFQKATEGKDIMFMILGESDSFDILGDKEMGEAGWVRKERKSITRAFAKEVGADPEEVMGHLTGMLVAEEDASSFLGEEND